MKMKLDLYVVTDENLSNGKTHGEIAKLAIAGGCDAVQLRDKKMGDEEFLSVAKEIRRVSDGKALFIVNDRFDIALQSNADGVHVGQDDSSPKELRQTLSKMQIHNFIIGVSVSSVEEAVRAERDGADYVAVSPVFQTPSKEDAGTGLGVEMISAIKSAVNVPVIGIGGINAENTPMLISAGLDGIAVISAVVSKTDIPKAAKELRCIVELAKEERKNV